MTKTVSPAAHAALLNAATPLWPVVYKRMRQAKRLTLRVSEAKRQIILTFPTRTPLKEAEAFLKAQTAWLQDQIAKATPIHVVAIGNDIPVYGKMRRIVHHPGATRGVQVTLTDEALEVTGRAERVPRAIYRFLKDLARTEIERLVAEKAARLPRPVKSLTLRDTNSRWGSCTPAGDLNFCWRLILAPYEVLDYVVGHEVAHLVHMHHRPSFWTLCRALTDYTTYGKNWLAQNGNSMHLVLAEAE